MNKFVPIPLLMTVWSLPVAVAYPADAPDNTVRIAAIWVFEPAVVPKTRTGDVATVPPRKTLDLRPPDLRSVQVQNPQQGAISADSDDAVAVTIVAPQLLPENSDTHLSLVGLGSLYWAARHPTQAWRVLLPIQPDDGSDASADIRRLPVSGMRFVGPAQSLQESRMRQLDVSELTAVTVQTSTR
jgi:hypothetical protein